MWKVPGLFIPLCALFLPLFLQDELLFFSKLTEKAVIILVLPSLELSVPIAFLPKP